jgi:hypothetical protein
MVSTEDRVAREKETAIKELDHMHMAINARDLKKPCITRK